MSNCNLDLCCALWLDLMDVCANSSQLGKGSKLIRERSSVDSMHRSVGNAQLLFEFDL